MLEVLEVPIYFCAYFSTTAYIANKMFSHFGFHMLSCYKNLIYSCVFDDCLGARPSIT